MATVSPKTEAMIRERFARDIAQLIIDYFTSRSLRPKRLARMGNYEACDECSWYHDEIFIGACSGGHPLIAKAVQKKTRRVDFCDGVLNAYIHGREKDMRPIFESLYLIPFDACVSQNLSALRDTCVFDGSIMYVACARGLDKVISFMISSRGIAVSHDYWLQAACKFGRLSAVKLLCSFGQSESTIQKMMLKASRNGHVEIVDYLCQKFNMTPPLWSMIYDSRVDMIKNMISRADSNEIRLACKYIGRATVDVAKSLIDAGDGIIDLNTMLFIACKYNNVDLAKLIISRGATNMNYGLNGAANRGCLKTAELMLSLGASDIKSAIEMMCKGLSCHTRMANLLIAHANGPIDFRVAIKLSDEYPAIPAITELLRALQPNT